MPGRLVVYGCISLPITSDELGVPALVGIFMRFWATVASAILLGLSLDRSTCPVEVPDLIILVGTLVLAAITLVLYVMLFWVSTTGTMLEWEWRTAKTPPLFNTLGILYLVEVGIAILGVARLATSNCPVQDILAISEITTVAAIALDFSILSIVLGLLVFFSRGKKPRMFDAEEIKKPINRIFHRMACLLCYTFQGVENPEGNNDLAWSEIARIVHAFLKDILIDFTILDFAAAFILLWKEQKASEKERVTKALSLSPVTSPKGNKTIRFKNQSFISGTPVTSTDKRAIEAMQLFHEFAPYMIGIYGWKLQLYVNPLTFIRQTPLTLWRVLKNGRNIEDHIFRDYIGSSPKRRVLYTSFTSYLGEAVPYTITVDHERKAVVISLRGTMSMADFATDLLCTPVNLGLAAKQWGVPNGEKHYAHGGMLLVANRIRADIERQQILHRLFRVHGETDEEQQSREKLGSDPLTKDDREAFLKAMGKSPDAPLPVGMMYSTEVFINEQELADMDCSNYRLICCGHSLGSCMASILSLLLRKRFPQIKCLAYSCVSAIFSRELADESSEWIYSCTVGKDFFGRLSWHSARELRDQLLDVLRRSKTSKAKIFYSLVSPRGVPVDELLYRPDQVPDDPVRREIQQKIEKLKGIKDHHLDHVHMYMPGRILYFEKTHTEVRRGCILSSLKSEYQPVWIEDRAEIQQILISTRLLLDHMPDYVMYVIDNALDRQVTDINTRVVNSGTLAVAEELLV